MTEQLFSSTSSVAGRETPQVAADEPLAAGAPRSPRPPSWAADLFEPVEPRVATIEDSSISSVAQADLELRDFGALCLTTLEVKRASAFDADSFVQATAEAYRRILGTLASIEAAHPLRVWNSVPDILQPLGELPHRYMAFNAGRFLAYRERYGSPQRFPSTLATASGTGHTGSSLMIHCLSSVEPGKPLENPRQLPSYRYSARYGPQPPCFARATLAEIPPGGARRLLVGGTASVLGENSAHVADLVAQFEETANNLKALLIAAPGVDRTGSASDRALSRFRHLRVYYTDRGARGTIESLVEERFDSLESLEYVHCDLCRPELLIEIEGVAEIG